MKIIEQDEGSITLISGSGEPVIPTEMENFEIDLSTPPLENSGISKDNIENNISNGIDEELERLRAIHKNIVWILSKQEEPQPEKGKSK